MLPKDCFNCCVTLSSVAFDAVCQTRSLGCLAFVFCFALQWICVPSPVETIGDHCFQDCPALSDVTFERHCRLFGLGEFAFDTCKALHSIRIPPSLREMTRLAMAGSAIRRVIVDCHNQFFRVADAFLVDSRRAVSVSAVLSGLFNSSAVRRFRASAKLPLWIAQRFNQSVFHQQ
jgi:hypothetical protein